MAESSTGSQALSEVPVERATKPKDLGIPATKRYIADIAAEPFVMNGESRKNKVLSSSEACSSGIRRNVELPTVEVY